MVLAPPHLLSLVNHFAGLQTLARPKPNVEVEQGTQPDLADVKLSHVWTGQCAGTFDMMPHFGGDDGVWYGSGYNFAGVPMGSFFGLKIAQRILGLPAPASAFEQAAFPTLPLYRGNPWFLPIAMRYFAWKDARLARGG